MKVKELIKSLQAFDPEWQVNLETETFILDSMGGQYHSKRESYFSVVCTTDGRELVLLTEY